MRHFVLPRPPVPLPQRVRVAPPQGLLVTLPGRAQRLAARLLRAPGRAPRRAIPVAAIATAANQHGTAAMRTQRAAGGRFHRERGRWLKARRARPRRAILRVQRRLSARGAAPGQTARSVRCRACFSSRPELFLQQSPCADQPAGRHRPVHTRTATPQPRAPRASSVALRAPCDPPPQHHDDRQPPLIEAQRRGDASRVLAARFLRNAAAVHTWGSSFNRTVVMKTLLSGRKGSCRNVLHDGSSCDQGINGGGAVAVLNE